MPRIYATHCVTKSDITIKSFSDVTFDNIANTIDTVEFTFDGTRDLLSQLNNILNAQQGDTMEISNVSYDDKYLIQTYSLTENPCNEIIVKRKLKQNDCYTFTHNILEGIEEDFEYVDFKRDDVIAAIRSKFVHKSLFVAPTNIINEVELLMTKINDDNDEIGNLFVKNISTGQISSHKFLFLQHLIVTLSEKYEEGLIDEEYAKILNANPDIEYIYTQHTLGLCIMSTYSACIGNTLNAMMSTLIKEQLYGNCFVCISDNNNHSSIPLDLTTELFGQLLSKESKLGSHCENSEVFCNPYIAIKAL
jgi:hypothetical protein